MLDDIMIALTFALPNQYSRGFTKNKCIPRNYKNWVDYVPKN